MNNNTFIHILNNLWHTELIFFDITDLVANGNDGMTEIQVFLNIIKEFDKIPAIWTIIL